MRFVIQQARDVRNNEVVAIKKMSYSGKQTNEVNMEKKKKIPQNKDPRKNEDP